MMLKNNFIFLLTILLSMSLMAQKDYIPVQCEGEIPSDFILRTQYKIELANQNSTAYKSSKLSKTANEEFNNTTNFYIDYLLKSGKIIFGTPMNDYLNQVGALVLEQFPEIKNEIRFYILKSPEVNASTTNQGIIFINLGLLAQLENEAQLAFIIAHELIHYKYHHVYEAYSEEYQAKYNMGKYQAKNYENKFSDLMQYSHKHEFMADSLGFLEAYSKLGYNFDEAMSVFDVLLYSNLPFDEIEFDTAYFDDENFKLNSKAVLKTPELISNPEDYKDNESTHPNIKKRRSAIIQLVTDHENVNKEVYVVSRRDFMESRKTARFEMSNLYLSYLQYGKAFYNSYLLLHTYPESQFLYKTMAFALYGISAHQNHGEIAAVLQSYKKMQGKSQRVFYSFRKMDKKTLNALAVKALWKYNLKFPEDQFMKQILEKSTYDLVSKYGLKYENIAKPILISANTENADSLLAIELNENGFRLLSEEEYNKLSKYDKIRYDKKYLEVFGDKSAPVEVISDKKNYLKVLASVRNDKAFKQFFNGIESEVKRDEQKTERDKVYVTKEQVTHFILVNPQYYKVENDQIIVSGSEEKEAYIVKDLKSSARQLGINMELIDILQIKSDEVDRFNDLAFFNSWVSEYYSLTDNDLHYQIPWQNAYMDAIKEKYDVNHIATMGIAVVSMDASIGKKFFAVLGGVIIPPLLPLAIVHAVNKKHRVLYYFSMVDIETNQILISSEDNLQGNLREDVISSLNYNALYQLKMKNKKR